MADKNTLQAEGRKVTGRKVKRLRTEGLLPANIFGKKVKSEGVQVKYADFVKIYAAAGETQIIDLTLSGKVRPVLVSNVQTDPVTDNFIHVDFHQIDLKEKVTATVPVELIGEAPAEKEGIGVLVQQINEIEVEALPADLPEHLEADVSALAKVDDAILVKDLKVDATKVKLEAEPGAIVAKIEEPRKEEEPEPVAPVEGAEGEEGEGVPAEGAAEEKPGEKSEEASDEGKKGKEE